MTETKGLIFLMNVLPDVQICPLRNKSAHKMYRSGSIANSQRMLTIAKIRDWVESDTVKH